MDLLRQNCRRRPIRGCGHRRLQPHRRRRGIVHIIVKLIVISRENTHLEMWRVLISHHAFSIVMCVTAVLTRPCHGVLLSLTYYFFFYIIYLFGIFELLNITLKFTPVKTHFIVFLLLFITPVLSTFKCTHRQLRSLITERIFSFTVHHWACQTSHLTFAPLSNITPRLPHLIIPSHLLPFFLKISPRAS